MSEAPDTFRIVDHRQSTSADDAAAQDSRRKAFFGQQRMPGLHDHARAATDYQLDPELEAAINAAICVDAPLLLTGEPGTGKTQVAYYLGAYFGFAVHPVHVRSTSTVQDLCYDFDAVAYLHWAQRGDETEQSRSSFLRKLAVWTAYEDRAGAVLLLDEIDKAPRDLPNDLLHILDQQWFKHPFEDRTIKPLAARPPIVIVTSNAERRLPDAFLRRCVHHELRLTPELITSIVQARASTSFPHLDDATLARARDIFWELREEFDFDKAPTTAEFLAWLAVLSSRGTSLDELASISKGTPAITVLIKLSEDRDKLSEDRDKLG